MTREEQRALLVAFANWASVRGAYISHTYVDDYLNSMVQQSAHVPITGSTLYGPHYLCRASGVPCSSGCPGGKREAK